MFANADMEGVLCFLLPICLIWGAIQLLIIIYRPDVYKAQLEDRRHRREQRNKVMGGMFSILPLFLGRRR